MNVHELGDELAVQCVVGAQGAEADVLLPVMNSTGLQTAYQTVLAPASANKGGESRRVVRGGVPIVDRLHTIYINLDHIRKFQYIDKRAFYTRDAVQTISSNEDLRQCVGNR